MKCRQERSSPLYFTRSSSPFTLSLLDPREAMEIREFTHVPFGGGGRCSTSDQRLEERGWKFLLRGSTLFLLAIFVHWQGTRFPWIWTDYSLIVENPLLRSDRGMLQYWLHPFTGNGGPLSGTLLYLQYAIFSSISRPYHILPLLAHACNCLLIWAILRRLRRRAVAGGRDFCRASDRSAVDRLGQLSGRSPGGIGRARVPALFSVVSEIHPARAGLCRQASRACDHCDS